MRAIDLAEQIPTVTVETTGAEAARVVAEYRLSGLVVADESGIPWLVIPGSQLLGLVLPGYLRDEPGLARALDEDSADEMCRRLTSTTIGQLLEARALDSRTPARVDPQDTLVEIASVMVEGRHPLILVVDEDAGYRGVLTTSRVLAAIAQLAGQDSALVRRRLERDIIRRGEPWLPDDPLGTSADPDARSSR